MRILLGSMIILLPTFPGFTQDDDKRKIKALEFRVQELEDKVEGMETALIAVMEFLDPKLADKVREQVEKAMFAKAKEKKGACASNLAKLWKLQMDWVIQFGGKTKRYADATGPAFWLTLTKTRPPLLDELSLSPLVCPASRELPRKDFTTYRGPSKDVNTLEAGGIVGCCESGHHLDGVIIVLRKSGDIIEMKPGDAGYEDVLKQTIGDPSRTK